VRLKVRQGYDAGGRLGSDGMDADTILSEDERILISESFKHEKEGKLVSLFFAVKAT